MLQVHSKRNLFVLINLHVFVLLTSRVAGSTSGHELIDL